MCFLWYFQEYNQIPENIFRNIFWNATKHMKTFSFPENNISGKWNIFRKYFYTNQTEPKIPFSGNAFTRTKRSLKCVFGFHNSSLKNQIIEWWKQKLETKLLKSKQTFESWVSPFLSYELWKHSYELWKLGGRLVHQFSSLNSQFS